MNQLALALILTTFFPPQTYNGSTPCKKRSSLAATPKISAELINQSIPIYAFERTQKDPAIIFSRTGSAMTHHPTIFIFLNGSWRLFDLTDDCFFQTTNWVHVARHKSYVWGIIDTDVEGRGWTLEIVFSRDGGRSWRHVSSIRKPYFMAEFSSFRMGAKGRGSLTAYLDDSSGPPQRAGLFTYRTRDWGRSWTRAQHSPDLLSGPDYRYEDAEHSERSLQEVMQDLGKK